MPFQIHALPRDKFISLFELSDDELMERNITRQVSDSDQGYPCRISLDEAPIGEDLLLVNYSHLAFATPYKATHAIYVSRTGIPPELSVDEIPPSLQKRALSPRLFSSDGTMLDADLANGETLSQKLNTAFENTAVKFVHIHNAKQGCFAAAATRPAEFDVRWLGEVA